MIYLVTWIVLGLVLCAAEIFIPSFFIFWFGLGAFAAAVASIFLGLTFQIVIFITVSAVLLIFTRPIVMKTLLKKGSSRKINIDEIVGKRAMVVERIDPVEGTGMVKVNGELWRALTEDNSVVTVGEYVTILKVEGTLLKVKKEG